jgi:NTE family protein
MLDGATVVMGAGGPWGVAWMTGMLFGLEERGIDVRSAGLVIGSSAGAIVGARLGSAHSLQALYEKEASIEEQVQQAGKLGELSLRQPATASHPAASGAASLMQIFGRDWNNEDDRIRALCDLAINAKTVSWEKFEEIGIPAEYRSTEWPGFPLKITVIDADERRLVTLDASSGVSVSFAVLASCSIPGLFPPALINGHRYTDGGSWGSGDNAHLAAGSPSVLVISPMAAQRSRNAAILDRDLLSLRTGGARVHSIVADEASFAARGSGAPNPQSMKAAAEAGRAQGHREAGELRRQLG